LEEQISPEGGCFVIAKLEPIKQAAGYQVGWIKRRRRVSTACPVDSRYAFNPRYKKYCATSDGEIQPEEIE